MDFYVDSGPVNSHIPIIRHDIPGLPGRFKEHSNNFDRTHLVPGCSASAMKGFQFTGLTSDPRCVYANVHG